jgi:CRP/FNR family transcriptional regulator, cyclic AMP receptor protein
MEPSAHKELLRQGRWYSGLPEAFQDALLQRAAVRRLAPGERLFARGDPPGGLFATVDGLIRICSTTEEGKEVLLTIQEPPSWFGEIAVFDRQPRTHDAYAAGEAVVLHVPTKALDDLLAQQPAWWRDLGLLVTQKLRLAFLAMEDAATQPLPARLARRLVLMADGYGDWHDRRLRALEVSQEQLASMLSTSRQTVNGALKDFEAKGLVRVAYGRIEVVDLDGLRALAG